MAVYKVLSSHRTSEGMDITGFAYAPVPASNNDAGVPWRTVVAEKRALRSNRKSVTPPVGVNEADLDSGLVYEWSWAVNVPAGLTPVQVRQAIEDHVAAEQATVANRISERFRYWGFTGSTD